MEGHGHQPLVEFDSDASEFARGFEAGRLWTVVRERPADVVEEYAHASNAEMVLRIADASGRAVRSEELDDGWLLVRFDVAGEDANG